MKRFFREYGGVVIAVFGILLLLLFITPAGNIVQSFISDTVSQTGSQSKVETNTQGSAVSDPSPGVTYTIEYELDGGKMSTKITSYSTLTETFELPTPYKTGYNFIGWTGSNGSTPETTVTIAKGSSGNRTYTANWRSNSTNVYIYNTKYISNSGVNLGTGTIEGVIGSTQTVHAPKKDGYITPANQKVTFDNSNPKTITFIYNPTLYAITYDLDGGTVSGLKSAYTVETNDFTLPEPTKTGFTFKGWTGSNGNTPQKSVTVSKGSSGTKSYKANWEGITYTYTVAYRSTSGKSLGSTTVQGFLGDTKTVTLPAKTGYKTPDNVSVVFDTVGSKTVTVTYEPINYNISFVKNGGTYSEPAIQYNIESGEIVLGNAYMAGTGFLGWYDNASFNGSRILSIPTGSTGNKTFYAKFSVDSYSITYYLDEGTMNGGLTTYTVNTTTFNLPTPAKTGYTFKGWTGTGLSGNTMTVTIPQGSTGDREYTAHWEINEYTYTFRYLSSTGKQLGSTTITNQFHEGEMVTPPDYAGYTTPAKQSVIWDSTTPKTIDFTYPIITYNISYDLNGGTASGLKTTYTVEDAQFRLPTPTKTGYSWEGWTGTGITEKRLSFSVPQGSTGNKEFYANWERKSYTYKLKTGLAFNALIPNTTTSVIFTDEAMPSSATLIDVDADGDGGVVGWLDGTTFKVSTQKSGQKIIANEDSSYMFCGHQSQGNKTTTTQNLVSIDFANVDTSSVTNMSYMFYYAGYNTTSWSVGDLSEWNTSKVTNMSYMFNRAGYSATSWSVGDLSGWDTSSVTNMSYMFNRAGYSATSFNLNLSGWDTSSVTNMSYMFYSVGYNTTSFNLNLSGWDTSSVTNMSSMFDHAGYSATSWFVGDLSGWDTSKAGNMAAMFNYAGYNTTSFNLNLSGWDTSGVGNMSYMFDHAGYSATSWSVGDLSGWDTSKAGNMYGMFYYAGYNASYNLNLSSWNVTKGPNYRKFNSGVEDKVTPPVWIN